MDIFSIYYQEKVYIFDQDFPDNEHTIQYKKAVVAGQTDLIKKILEAPNPKRVKEIGDSITTNQRRHEMKKLKLLSKLHNINVYFIYQCSQIQK